MQSPQADDQLDDGAQAERPTLSESGTTQVANARHIFFDNDSDQARDRNEQRYKIAPRTCHLYHQKDVFAAYRSWERHTGKHKNDVPPYWFVIKGPQPRF